MGIKQFLDLYRESIADGIARPFELVYFTSEGEVRKTMAHKPFRKEIQEQSFTDSPRSLGYLPHEKKIVLIEIPEAQSEREKYRSIKIALIVRCNGILIDHQR
jgi:hypothetical protein